MWRHILPFSAQYVYFMMHIIWFYKYINFHLSLWDSIEHKKSEVTHHCRSIWTQGHRRKAVGSSFRFQGVLKYYFRRFSKKFRRSENFFPLLPPLTKLCPRFSLAPQISKYGKVCLQIFFPLGRKFMLQNWNSHQPLKFVIFFPNTWPSKFSILRINFTLSP